MRTGVQALSLFASPLNGQVLAALDGEPVPLADLRRAVGHPPVTTMRSYLRALTDLGVLDRQREDDFPGSVTYVMAPPGRKLLAVGGALQWWLETAPEVPLSLGSIGAKSVIKALIDGWEAGIVRALAARPLALTELDRLIPHVSYPALERRLTAMRQVGLVEPVPKRDGRVARCQVTPWLRRAVVPFSAAVGWERQCIPGRVSAPAKIDIEAAILLAVPLLDLSSDVNGTCRLAVECRRGNELDYAGVVLVVEEGKVRSCSTRLEGEADAWAAGSVLDWFRWLREDDDGGVEIGGDAPLARALEQGFGNALMPTVGG